MKHVLGLGREGRRVRWGVEFFGCNLFGSRHGGAVVRGRAGSGPCRAGHAGLGRKHGARSRRVPAVLRDGGGDGIPLDVDVGNVTTYTVTGLADGATYYFAVTAYDSVGNESGYSNEVVYTTPGVGEINLVGNAVSIADGDTTPSTADFTDFGSTDVTGGTVDAHLHDPEHRHAALNLSGTPLVAVSGTNAADFTVTVPPAASVAAAGSTTFQVRFDPSAAGARAATITIANNDADREPLQLLHPGRRGPRRPEINLSATRSRSPTATPRPRRPTSPTSAARTSPAARSRAPSRSRTPAPAP